MKLPNLILFDEPEIRGNLQPFTFSRPVADIRVGILTIRQKWELATGLRSSTVTEPYLSKKFPVRHASVDLFVNGSILPDDELLTELSHLKTGECLVQGPFLLAAVIEKHEGVFSAELTHKKGKLKACKTEPMQVRYLWDIFSKNDKAIEQDFAALTARRKSRKPDASNRLIDSSNDIFIEEGAKVHCAMLNAGNGPIYIGRDAEVMEGAMIRGPFALCDHAVVKMGAKIYGATTVGPYSKVGGEIHNSVIFGYSNKAHDGFLGNSVIGEWCNLGADTNNSNLKNNYAPVRVWHYPSASFMNTGLQFCGLFMGDHSKCGINTMFNTGTVVGFSANVFGEGFPRNFVPSFSWGGTHGLTPYRFDKAMETAARMMERRGMQMDELDKDIWKHIFEQTEQYRKKIMFEV
ncbi:MAG TPA: GlmU family protein [Chitinophagales bacterium]|nr:GlmU family protein [Chitinophagales bacterium]